MTEDSIRAARLRAARQTLPMVTPLQFRSRVLDLQEATWIREGRTPFEVMQEQQAIAFSSQDDLFSEGPDGMPTPRPWGEIPEHAKRALKSVKIKKSVRATEDGGEITEQAVEFTFYDKQSALKFVAEHMAMAEMPVWRKSSEGTNTKAKTRTPVLTIEGAREPVTYETLQRSTAEIPMEEMDLDTLLGD